MWFSPDFDHFYFEEDKSAKFSQGVARQKISFSEFAKNKSNFKFLQEFNRLNDYQPNIRIFNSKTKDILKVNKGFIYGLFDQEEETDTSKYEYLADNKELMNDIVDFTDPAALLRRQKRILESIEK